MPAGAPTEARLLAFLSIDRAALRLRKPGVLFSGSPIPARLRFASGAVPAVVQGRCDSAKIVAMAAQILNLRQRSSRPRKSLKAKPQL
jgi:hypothetical protein